MSASIVMAAPAPERSTTYIRTDSPCVWCLGVKAIWVHENGATDWDLPVQCPECFGTGVHFQKVEDDA